MEICSCSGSNQMPKDVAIDQGSSAIVSSSDIQWVSAGQSLGILTAF